MAPVVIPKLFTVDEVAHMVRAPRSTVLDWLYRGKLRSVKLGRRRLVPDYALHEYIAVRTAILATDQSAVAARGDVQ